jgi:hypothetical protein
MPRHHKRTHLKRRRSTPAPAEPPADMPGERTPTTGSFPRHATGRSTDRSPLHQHMPDPARLCRARTTHTTWTHDRSSLRHNVGRTTVSIHALRSRIKNSVFSGDFNTNTAISPVFSGTFNPYPPQTPLSSGSPHAVSGSHHAVSGSPHAASGSPHSPKPPPALSPNARPPTPEPQSPPATDPHPTPIH